MSSLFLPSYALPRLAVVVLLGIIVGCNSVLAEEILISDESVVLDLPSVENTFPEVLPEVSMLKEVPPVAEILPEVAPEPLVEILVVPDILFADTPAEEADLSLPTDTVRVPLFGTDSS